MVITQPAATIVDMSLVQLWEKSEQELRKKSVRQLISIAGEGRLIDGSKCASEFRELLSYVPSEIIAAYSKYCLEEKFEDSGLALQDVVNQIGRRLGFEVTDGRYKGVQGQTGFDGIWKSEDGYYLVIEVKTTDAYRINLDTAAGYRAKLSEQNKIARDASSVLIIIGRQDTGDLEAQIRGSRHAWDIRLLSVDALLQLLSIREETEDPAIQAKISQILRPRDYTRLDAVVDLVFTTAEDIQDQQLVPGPAVVKSSVHEKAERDDPPAGFHNACIEKLSVKLGEKLVRQSRSIFVSPHGEVAMSCSVSKEYIDTSHKGYWYAFHPHQADLLKKAKKAYVAFGCGSAERIILIPYDIFEPLLKDLNTTARPTGKTYWHVQIADHEGKWELRRKGGLSRIDVTKYLV